MDVAPQARPNAPAVYAGKISISAAESAVPTIVKEAVLAARAAKEDMLQAAASSIRGVIRAAGSGGADVAGVTRVAISTAVEVCTGAGCDRAATFSTVRRAGLEIARTIGSLGGDIVRQVVGEMTPAPDAAGDAVGQSREVHPTDREHA